MVASWDASLGMIADAAAERSPDVPISLDHALDVLPSEPPSFGFARFAELVRQSSGWLFAAGLRAGDVVAIAKPNNFDVVTLAFGAARMGAVPLVLSSALGPPTLATLLTPLRPSLLLTDCHTLSALHALDVSAQALPPRIVTVNGPAAGAIPLADLHGAQPPDPIPRGPDDIALITHTSGTTGLPKLTGHAGRGLEAQAQAQVLVSRFLRYDRHEPVATCVSYTHVRTIAGVLAICLLGLPLVGLTNPDPASVAPILAALKPGYLEAHPGIFLHWEPLAHHPSRPLAPVRFFVSTFDAVHPRTIRKLLAASARRMPVYVQAYGQSEVGPATLRIYTRGSFSHSADAPAQQDSEPRSAGTAPQPLPPAGAASGRTPLAADDDRWMSRCVGWPIPGLTEIRIIDPQTRRRQRTGRSGLIQVASTARSLTYDRAGKPVPETGSGKWWSTGDLGFKTRLGCLHFLGRQVDASTRVETLLGLEDVLLDRLDDLAEIVIVRMPDGSLVPVVSTSENTPLNQHLWARATGDLPKLEKPVQLRWEEFPRTPTWKVRRRALVDQLDAMRALASQPGGS